MPQTRIDIVLLPVWIYILPVEVGVCPEEPMEEKIEFVLVILNDPDKFKIGDAEVPEKIAAIIFEQRAEAIFLKRPFFLPHLERYGIPGARPVPEYVVII